MQQDYTYAVARVRFRETRLLSNADLNALLTAKDETAALRLLKDKGWGDRSEIKDHEQLLCEEEKKLWDFVAEVTEDQTVFDFLRVPNDFHNLKVAVKCITRDVRPDGLFISNAVVPPEVLFDAVQKREYHRLPDFLSETVHEAMTVLLQTSDGQLCDIVADRACMEYVTKLGRESGNEIIRLYCELFTASADIKIAVRSALTKKKPDFIRRALAPCETLDSDKLAAAAAIDFDAIVAYLAATEYRSAVDAIRTSMSAFEKWCDDYLIAALKSQKWEPFNVGAIIAYIIARESEIKAVRLILSAKSNGIDGSIVKERLRNMYV